MFLPDHPSSNTGNIRSRRRRDGHQTVRSAKPLGSLGYDPPEDLDLGSHDGGLRDGKIGSPKGLQSSSESISTMNAVMNTLDE